MYTNSCNLRRQTEELATPPLIGYREAGAECRKNAVATVFRFIRATKKAGREENEAREKPKTKGMDEEQEEFSQMEMW